MTFTLTNVQSIHLHCTLYLVCIVHCTLVAGACSERKKMFLGGSFFKLADDNKYMRNPEAQNQEVRGF